MLILARFGEEEDLVDWAVEQLRYDGQEGMRVPSKLVQGGRPHDRREWAEYGGAAERIHEER